MNDECAMLVMNIEEEWLSVCQHGAKLMELKPKLTSLRVFRLNFAKNTENETSMGEE